MVFSSIVFLFYFLPTFLTCFHAFGRSKYALLIFSLVFYAWGEPLYVFLMLLSIAMNHRFGIMIDERDDVPQRRKVLALAVAANLGGLIFFKYTGFLAGNLFWLLDAPMPNWDIFKLPLPLGISFYTFHALSYLIDVYRRDVPAERSLRDLGVYMTMFPQLVAGPIIRYKFIASELHQPIFSSDRTAAGIRLFVIGLGQKVLLANTFAASVDPIFALSPEQLTTGLAWLGTVLYTLQIYYDFGGYSLMAMGLGLLIGFTYPINFNHPYAARSVTDFWRRWHISLSSWFRDYVYIPLGGNRAGAARTYVNLFIVFLLCGIWHGASWNFVIWGMIHGCMLIVERAGWGAVLARLPTPLQMAYTLLVVMIAWVFFRVDGFWQAIGHLNTMAGLAPVAAFPADWTRFVGIDVQLAFIVALLAAGPWGQAALDRALASTGRHWVLVDAARLTALVGIVLVVSLSLAGGAYNPFIYFRF